MKATYVLPARTPLSFDDAAECMNGALAIVLNATPSTEVLALALAKTGLETARWQAIWNGNWGNIKCSDTYEGSFTCIGLNEVVGHTVRWFAPAGELNRKDGEVIGKVWPIPPGHPQTRLRAYSDATAGAHDYVDFVASGRYRDAFGELLEGDAVGYVHALKLKGYFTASEASYTRGVASLQKEFIARLRSKPIEIDDLLPSVEDVRGLIAQQPANAEAVRSWIATEDSARAATRQARNVELFGDPNGLQDPDDDETTVNDPPRNA